MCASCRKHAKVSLKHGKGIEHICSDGRCWWAWGHAGGRQGGVHQLRKGGRGERHMGSRMPVYDSDSEVLVGVVGHLGDANAMCASSQSLTAGPDSTPARVLGWARVCRVAPVQGGPAGKTAAPSRAFSMPAALHTSRPAYHRIPPHHRTRLVTSM